MWEDKLSGMRRNRGIWNNDVLCREGATVKEPHNPCGQQKWELGHLRYEAGSHSGTGSSLWGQWGCQERLGENRTSISLKSPMSAWGGFHHSVNKDRSAEFLSKLTCSWPDTLSFMDMWGPDNGSANGCSSCWAQSLFHILQINKAGAKWPWLESDVSHKRLVAHLRQLG